MVWVLLFNQNISINEKIMSGVTTLLGLFFIINGNMTQENSSTSTSTIDMANIAKSNETNVTTTFSNSSTDNTTISSSIPTTTRKVKNMIDKEYEHYINVIKPTVYEVSFYMVVISVAVGLVLNPVAALVFGTSGMGRTPVGKEILLLNYFFEIRNTDLNSWRETAITGKQGRT